MARARTVRPTDLVALVAYDGRVYPNEAVTRDRIGTTTSPHPLEAALEQWFSFATGRHTWISIKGATLRGLVSARRRGSNAAWEIDCLIDAAEDDPGVLMSLLDQVAADAGRVGAEKVFLRVAATSAVVRTAGSSGFSVYLTERLLAAGAERRRAASVDGESLNLSFRRWSRADAELTFRLYNRWTPEPVRRVEAATFREWLAARERVSPTRGAYQQVIERSGRIVGWLRAAATSEIGRFDVMADPSLPELLDPLIETALARLHEQSALFALAPEFAAGLRERLEERGFAEQGEFAVLARRTTRTVAMPQLAPVAPVQFFPA
jgi:hypothetical protein